MTATAEQIEQMTVGQRVRCTISHAPKAEGARKTIERLMRFDPENAKGLRRAQALRQRRLNVYIRGNRRWVAREKAARVVRAIEGRSWEMNVIPKLVPDLKSVAAHLTIQSL